MSSLGNTTASFNGGTAVNPTCAIDRYVNEPNRLYGVSIAGLPAEISPPATRTRSPTWRPTRGLCRGGASNRTLRDFQTLSAGSFRSPRGPTTERAYSRERPDPNRATVTEENRKVLFGQTVAGPKEA
jgi:GST-like protein